jgi:hypothetical protein
LRGHIGAQKEFELKDGPKGRRLRRSPKAILDFKFFLRLRLTVRFKGRWLHSSSFELAWTRSAGRQKNLQGRLCESFPANLVSERGQGAAASGRGARNVPIFLYKSARNESFDNDDEP